MSDIVALSRKRVADARKIAIGLLRLSDSAPAIVAHEFGFFADEGLDVALSFEPSWANVADKLAYGVLDAAVIVPPLAFAVSLGLRGAAQPLVIPYCVSRGGNTITLAKGLADEVRAVSAEGGVAAALAARLQGGDGPATFGVVHDYSTHNLLLRYWFAAAGVALDRDVRLSVVPPARTVEALREGRIVGFCAGAPWGEIAARAGVGATIASSRDIWRNSPEKAFAVRERWADANPEALRGLLRAFYRAAQFCDAPDNAAYVAALLSRRTYLDLDSHVILSSLPGTLGGETHSHFHRGATTFPWRSQALWFLDQMTRWDLIDPGLPLREIAERVYRPDLYAGALARLGAPIPAIDSKPEGAHAEGWTLPASPSPIAMDADLFCDRAVFDPASLAASRDVAATR